MVENKSEEERRNSGEKEFTGRLCSATIVIISLEGKCTLARGRKLAAGYLHGQARRPAGQLVSLSPRGKGKTHARHLAWPSWNW